MRQLTCLFVTQSMPINNFFKAPRWVDDIERNFHSVDRMDPSILAEIKRGLEKFASPDAEVSIVMPVYNEEKTLLKTLASFSRMKTKYSAELIVVNNNSQDSTREIAETLGVSVVDEPRQGISFARQAGLSRANGKYFLNADGDSIYPPGWIDAYAEALKDPAVTCAYGTYSFFPSEGLPRMALSAYEGATRFFFNVRRKKMDFFNVLGFNFAFRTEDGRKVGGFNTTRKRWSDAWMAMMLQQYGQIKRITSPDARVWTSDRRLMIDGGILKSVKKRFNKEVKYHLETPDFKTEIKEYQEIIKSNA